MKEKMSRTEAWNSIAVFILLLFGLSIASVLWPKRGYSETENRTLAQMPRVNAQKIFDGSFESEYETYLTDQFLLRDGWISLKTAAERLTLRQESKDIYFGADHYLIEKHSGEFTSEQALRNVTVLRDFVDAYRDRFRGHMTITVIPNAVDVMKDHLPMLAAPYNEEDYLDVIRKVVPSDIWLEASELLRDRYRAGYEDYYRTDHHWRTEGAFQVYRLWAQKQGWETPQKDDYQITAVTDEFEGTIQSKLGIHTVTDTIEIYEAKNDPFYTVQKDDDPSIEYSLYERSALDTKDKYGIFFGGNTGLIRIRTKVHPDRKLLVIKDSYANCFVPFTLEEFGAVDLLDVRYYNQKVSELIRDGGYTDLLFLYNAAGFAGDAALGRILL